MSAEEKTVLMIKGVMSELPAAEREACLELAEHMRMQIKSAGNTVGPLALALVGAELQLKNA